MAKAIYQAVCDRCYTCVVGQGSKRDANIAAVGHMNAYGHNVIIIVKGGKS